MARGVAPYVGWRIPVRPVAQTRRARDVGAVETLRRRDDHSDLERGVIGAEVIPYATFLEHDSGREVRLAGFAPAERCCDDGRSAGGGVRLRSLRGSPTVVVGVIVGPTCRPADGTGYSQARRLE
jgi:hypothetical protein